MMRLPLLQHLGRSRLSRGVGTTASIGSSNSTTGSSSTIHQIMMMSGRGGMRRTGSSSATRPATAPPTEASPQRLFLWVPTAQIIAGSHHDALSLSGKENDPSHHRQQRSTLLQQHVLLPSAAIQQFVEAQMTTMQVVQSVDDIVAAVNQHYSIDHHHKDRDDGDDDAPQPPARTQFVGGMGEQDLGVYFVSLPSGEDSSYQDLLHHTETIELLRDGIEHVKAIRHGVPFGLYTSGLLREPPNEDHDLSFLKELNLDVLEVSLFGWDSSGSGGHPAERYHQFLTSTVGRKDAQKDDLQHICQFITSAVESQQQNVHVSLLQPPKNHHHTWDTKEAAQLAMSLGAQEVHYYTKE